MRVGARALVPSHPLLDGDLLFAAATGAPEMGAPEMGAPEMGAPEMGGPLRDAFQILHAAAIGLAGAVAWAVFLAGPMPGDLQPCRSG